MDSNFLLSIVARFLLSLGGSAILTYVYYLYAYNEKTVRWDTALRFAILFTILLTIRQVIKGKFNK